MSTKGMFRVLELRKVLGKMEVMPGEECLKLPYKKVATIGLGAEKPDELLILSGADILAILKESMDWMVYCVLVEKTGEEYGVCREFPNSFLVKKDFYLRLEGAEFLL